MASNPQVEPSQTISARKQTLAFSLLVCTPLIVGGVRNATSPQPIVEVTASPTTSSQPRLTANPESELAYNNDATLLVAAFPDDAVIVAQTDRQSKSEIKANKKADKKANKKKKIKAKSAKKDDTTDEAAPKTSEPVASDDVASDDVASDGVDSDEGPECCNANSEFSNWSATLDDDIQNAVIGAITSKLTSATENLDKQQERLERLQVETELYKLQIQHLRNRLKEWADD